MRFYEKAGKISQISHSKAKCWPGYDQAMTKIHTVNTIKTITEITGDVNNSSLGLETYQLCYWPIFYGLASSLLAEWWPFLHELHMGSCLPSDEPAMPPWLLGSPIRLRLENEDSIWSPVWPPLLTWLHTISYIITQCSFGISWFLTRPLYLGNTCEDVWYHQWGEASLAAWWGLSFKAFSLSLVVVPYNLGQAIS